MTHSTLPTTIHASIDPAAIGRVNAFFDATAEQTIAELYQNARRSGATRIVVTAGRDGRIEVLDNGSGIADPAALLSFGRSDWQDDAASEHPAGMGLYALARHGGVVTSHAPGKTPWRVRLEPGHFTGERAAAVETLPAANTPPGTAVSVTIAQNSPGANTAAARHVARYLPVEVVVNGQEVPQWDFLGHAIDREKNDDVDIGVQNGNADDDSQPTINFHGLPLQAKLPQVATCNGWLAGRVNVNNCHRLELVLPARLRAVENPFLDILRDRVRKAIYRTVAKFEFRVPHSVQTAAAAAGIHIPDPKPRLERAEAAPADSRRYNYNRSEPVEPDNAIIVPRHWATSTINLIERAREASHTDWIAYYADEQMSGYQWYDQLPKATDVRTRYSVDGARRTITYERSSPRKLFEPTLAERIEIVLALDRPFRKNKTLALESDIAFERTTHDRAPGVRIGLILRKDTPLTPEEAADFARNALLRISDAVDSPSADEQTERFETEVMEAASRLIESEDTALRKAIARSIAAGVTQHCPAKGRVRIRISDREAEIVELTTHDETTAAR